MKNRTHICLAPVYLSLAVGGLMRILYLIKYPVQPRDAFLYLKMIEEIDNYNVFVENANFNMTSPLGILVMKSSNDILCFGIQRSILCLNLIAGLCVICCIVCFVNTLSHSILRNYISGMIAATHPSLIQYSCQILRENIFILECCLFFFFFLLYIKKGKSIFVVLFSIMSALAFLTRVEGVEILFGGILFLFINTFFDIRKKIFDCFLYLAFFIISTNIILNFQDISFQYILLKYLKVGKFIL